MPTLSFANLHLLKSWTAETGQSIAANLPDAQRIIFEEDGFRLYGIASKPFAGWLAKLVLKPIIPLTAIHTINFNYTVVFDDACALSLNSYETDVMAVGHSGSVFNLSGENDYGEDGHWHIVGSPKTPGGVYPWIDTGFIPGVQPHDTSVDHSFVYSVDGMKNVSSVKTLNVAGKNSFDIPVNLQSVPIAPLAWTPDEIIIQGQMGFKQTGGAASFKFTQMDLSVTY